jgi:hypothetical protein
MILQRQGKSERQLAMAISCLRALAILLHLVSKAEGRRGVGAAERPQHIGAEKLLVSKRHLQPKAERIRRPPPMPKNFTLVVLQIFLGYSGPQRS